MSDLSDHGCFWCLWLHRVMAAPALLSAALEKVVRFLLSRLNCKEREEKWSLWLNMYERTTRDRLTCDFKSNKPITVSLSSSQYIPLYRLLRSWHVLCWLKILHALSRASSFVYSLLKSRHVSLPSGRERFPRPAVQMSSQELVPG